MSPVLLRHLAIDAGVLWLTWNITYLFRLGFDRWLSARPAYDLFVIGGIVVAYLGVFVIARIPQALWRYSSLRDIQRLTLAVAIAGALAAIVISPVLQLQKVPRAVLALHPLVALMGLSLARLLTRSMVEHWSARQGLAGAPVRWALVLGAGEAAKRLVAGIQHQGWQVLGFLDDDPRKQGLRIAGLPVLGPMAAVAELAQRHHATHLIYALPSVRGAQRRRILEAAETAALPLLTVPSAQELQEGMRAERLRDIEPEDLLGREPVTLDESPVLSQVQASTVLVTGAGGSIGAELVMQLAALQPAQLVLVDHSEIALYRIDQRLRERFPELAFSLHLADVKSMPAMNALLASTRPRLVFHAAAYKHVPLVESGNGNAALANNTLGTWVVAQAAAAAGVSRMVLISTDKAVNPTNIMGATKRAAEIVLAAFAQQAPHTQFMAVRFGNVLGSSGSVIPRFKQQLAQGGPITVTHPDIIRYFMTIPEACRLVLQAAALGQTGQVLVLDMGEPVRIQDLARSMIRLSGHTETEIPIVFTGLRPGEKLFEELLADHEHTVPTPVPQIRVARLASTQAWADVSAWLDATAALQSASSTPSDAEIRTHLQRLVPELSSPPGP